MEKDRIIIVLEKSVNFMLAESGYRIENEELIEKKNKKDWYWKDMPYGEILFNTSLMMYNCMFD